MSLFEEMSVSQVIENVCSYINNEVDHCTRELLKIYGIKVCNNPTSIDIIMLQNEMEKNNIELHMNDNNLNTKEIILRKDGEDLFKYEIKTVYEGTTAKIYTNFIKITE